MLQDLPLQLVEVKVELTGACGIKVDLARLTALSW
jgi:hypothetical protein